MYSSRSFILEINASEVNNIFQSIEENNMDIVLLEKEPKIAVYSPPDKLPWDDAVTLALTYAEINYTIIFDDEVLQISCLIMIGCIFIMKILQDNMVNFIKIIEINHGIKKWRQTLIKLLINMDFQVYII